MDQFEFDEQGTIKNKKGSNNQVGRVENDIVYNASRQQVGYLRDDAVYAGGNGAWGGQQVGYIRGNEYYLGGNGAWGGTRGGELSFPHPRWKLAAHLLLT